MPSRCRALTRDAAAELVARAFAAPSAQLCGVEVEWPVHRRGLPTARPAYADLAALAEAPLPCGARVTIEPGGQLELSTRPLESADAALDAAAMDTVALHGRLRAAGFEPVESAVDTRRMPHRILEAPRYACMEQFFEARSCAGSWMMCNTASLQVNVAHQPLDVQRRWALTHQLGPVLVAAFGNSPGIDRQGRRWQSMRQAIWWSIDPGRTRPVPTSRPGPDALLDYALAADVMLIRSADEASVEPVAPGLSFGRWLTDGHPCGWPTADDLAYHLTTLFPPVRPKGWLELRMLDLVEPWLREVATLVVMAALTTDAARELQATLPDTSDLWCSAARHGLAHPVLGRAANTLMDAILPRLGEITSSDVRRDNTRFFAERYVAQRTSPAQLVTNQRLRAPFAPDLGMTGEPQSVLAG